MNILFSCILLLIGCAGLKHQTSESEPHALVEVAPDSGSRENPVVERIDGRKVKPGRKYRVSPGEHQIIVLSMQQFNETYETSKIFAIGDTGQSAATLKLPQAGDPELSGNTPPPFGSAVQPVNVRAEGWVRYYITNAISLEAGWRYELDGEHVEKVQYPIGEPRQNWISILNEQDEKGFTALNRAAFYGETSFAKELLESSANPDIADNEGFTPLHSAVEHGHTDIAALLLAYHADPNKACAIGRSPLHQAAARNDPESLLMLLNAGAAVDAVCPAGTPLSHAVQNNDQDTVRILLEYGASLNVSYEKDGLTPLHWASRLGQGNIAAILIDAGADVNNMSPYHGTPLHAASSGREATLRFSQQALEKLASRKTSAVTPVVGSDQDYAALWHVLLTAEPNLELREAKYGRTALGNAANQGNETAVIALIGAGADINAASRYGQTPLHEAAAIKAPPTLQSNIVVHLIDAGADIKAHDTSGGTPLHAAANSGNPVMIQLLLDAGADVNSIGPMRCQPLIFAVMKRDPASVRLLLDAGAGVDLPNGTGSSALLQAVMMQQHEIINMLLKYGADPNAGSADHTTALILSAANGDLETMQLLLDHGAQVNTISNQGVTALLAASSKGQLEAARLLIRHGATNAVMVENGSAPLIQAARGGHLELAGFLLDHGAAINAANRFGFTALHEASDQGHAEVAELLLNQGADPNGRSKKGSTPLQIAAGSVFANEERDVAVITVLLDHGADINLKDTKAKQTPLHRAAVWGRPNVLQVLIDAGADLTARDAAGKTALDIACDSFNPGLDRVVTTGRKACEQRLRKATPPVRVMHDDSAPHSE